MGQEHLFSYCHLELQDKYAIVTCNEGVHIDFTEIQEIEAVLQSVYQKQRYGLIANRENRYSVNPLALKKLFSDEYLVAGAIVGAAMKTRLNAEIENKNVDCATVGLFPSMNIAIKWVIDKVGKDCNDLVINAA